MRRSTVGGGDDLPSLLWLLLHRRRSVKLYNQRQNSLLMTAKTFRKQVEEKVRSPPSFLIPCQRRSSHVQYRVWYPHFSIIFAKIPSP
ncbi:MAG: hypothetical protein WBL95_14530 [Microcoleus sp.]